MKFSSSDTDYLSRRKKISEKYGSRELWSVIDHWPLYCGISNLARFLAISDLVRRSLAVPGHIAEFGSWRGANLLFMAKLLRILDTNGCKGVHCFDSFEGLQTFRPQDRSTSSDRGRYTGSLEELKDMIDLYGMDDEITIHVGDVSETVPAFLEEQPAFSLSFVYLDMDLYHPTKDVLEAVHGRLSRGGLIALDEWNYETFPGETEAVREFLARHGSIYHAEHVRNTRQPSLVLVKTEH